MLKSDYVDDVEPVYIGSYFSFTDFRFPSEGGDDFMMSVINLNNASTFSPDSPMTELERSLSQLIPVMIRLSRPTVIETKIEWYGKRDGQGYIYRSALINMNASEASGPVLCSSFSRCTHIDGKEVRRYFTRAIDSDIYTRNPVESTGLAFTVVYNNFMYNLQLFAESMESVKDEMLYWYSEDDYDVVVRMVWYGGDREDGFNVWDGFFGDNIKTSYLVHGMDGDVKYGDGYFRDYFHREYEVVNMMVEATAIKVLQSFRHARGPNDSDYSHETQLKKIKC